VAEEIEILGTEGVAQRGGVAVQHLPAQISLPVFHRMLLQHGLKRLEEGRRGHDVLLRRRRLHQLEIKAPIP
jgi:hypothetical protein